VIIRPPIRLVDLLLLRFGGSSVGLTTLDDELKKPIVFAQLPADLLRELLSLSDFVEAA